MSCLARWSRWNDGGTSSEACDSCSHDGTSILASWASLPCARGEAPPYAGAAPMCIGVRGVRGVAGVSRMFRDCCGPGVRGVTGVPGVARPRGDCMWRASRSLSTRWRGDSGGRVTDASPSSNTCSPRIILIRTPMLLDSRQDIFPVAPVGSERPPPLLGPGPFIKPPRILRSSSSSTAALLAARRGLRRRLAESSFISPLAGVGLRIAGVPGSWTSCAVVPFCT